jgi:hypothetical protein
MCWFKPVADMVRQVPTCDLTPHIGQFSMTRTDKLELSIRNG